MESKEVVEVLRDDDVTFSIRPVPNTCCPDMNNKTIKELGYCDGCNKIYDKDLFKEKACLALEFQNSLIKDLISFEKIADVENAVNTKSAINSYRIMLERRLNGKQ